MSDFLSHDLQIVNGQIVETDALRIAERVHELNPNLRVQVLESAPTMLGEPPFRVIERGKDGRDHIVLTAWELNETILMRLRAADMSQHDVLARIEKNNQKIKDQQKKDAKESLEQGSRVMYDVMKSPKSKYSVPNEDGTITTFYEDRPSETT